MNSIEEFPLVSIISPCYNEERYISNFLNSILNQSYSNIELIMVDDGSTDATASIIDEYKDKFLEKGYSLIYIYQKHSGQTAAINKGLKIFKGRYLMWVNADDILYKDNILKKAGFLQSNKEYGLVLCWGEIVSSNNIDIKIRDYKRKRPIDNDNLFEDLLFGRNVVFGSGNVMVTREAFEKSIPSGQIYESSEGQNLQFLLPISYFFKCGYIEECLFKYVSHSDSHTGGENSDYVILTRMNNLIILYENIISQMDINDSEKQKYINIIQIKYSLRIIKLIVESNSLQLCDYSDLINKNLQLLMSIKSLYSDGIN